MKPNFFCPIVLTMGLVLSFVSCANYNNEEESVPTIEANVTNPYEDLIVKINTIQIPESNIRQDFCLQESMESRGKRWKTFWKWCGLVLSDALGSTTVKLNVKGEYDIAWDLGKGISTSITTLEKFKKKNDPGTSESEPTNLHFCIAPMPSEGGVMPILRDSSYWKPGTHFNVYPGSHSDCTAHNAGYYHNLIITELYNEYGNGMLSMSTHKLDSLISIKVANYNEQTGLAYNTEVGDTAIVNFISDACVNSETIDECIQKITLEYPYLTSELQVIKALFERFEEIDFDIENGEFAAEATYVIGNSDIPAEVKNRLETMLSVGNASIRLWNFDLFSNNQNSNNNMQSAPR